MFKAVLYESGNKEDFIKTAVNRYIHKWCPLLRKSNENFIAAPVDVHFVLLCHIMDRNFAHDQFVFQMITENRLYSIAFRL